MKGVEAKEAEGCPKAQMNVSISPLENYDKGFSATWWEARIGVVAYLGGGGDGGGGGGGGDGGGGELWEYTDHVNLERNLQRNTYVVADDISFL